MVSSKKRDGLSPHHRLVSMACLLAMVSGATAFGLLSPGLKDITIAAANKYLGLGMSLDAPWWVGFFALAFCIGMVAVALWASKAPERVDAGKPFIAFRHHSLRSSVSPLLTQDAIPAGLGRRTLTHVDCDLTTQLADGAPGNNDLKTAIEEQQRQVERLLGLIRSLPDAKTAYYGIAHLPFQVLAGRMLGPAIGPQLYELDGDRATWRPLLDGNGTSLDVQRLTVPSVGLLASVAIRISVSFEVALDDVHQVMAEPFEDIHIRLARPARNIVTHLGQVDAVCREFRVALDSLQNRMAPGGRVHLFVSAPMSVGFSLGRVLSNSINPDVTCYNHTTQGVPRYSWGIRVNTNDPSSRMVVRPKPLPTATPITAP